MIYILLLGGYSGFGGRIARHLVAAGHRVIVAGRCIDKARAFCGETPGLTPLALDRSQIATALDEHEPSIAVDASGPFQAMDHAIPMARTRPGCIMSPSPTAAISSAASAHWLRQQASSSFPVPPAFRLYRAR